MAGLGSDSLWDLAMEARDAGNGRGRGGSRQSHGTVGRRHDLIGAPRSTDRRTTVSRWAGPRQLTRPASARLRSECTRRRWVVGSRRPLDRSEGLAKRDMASGSKSLVF